MRNKGFTLAEVLITLAIIGVIASLTIPVVVQSSGKQQFITGVQKAYNTLKTVQSEAEVKYGPMRNWDWTETTEYTFDAYFKDFFDIMSDCGMTEKSGCFAGGTSTSDIVKWLNGSELKSTDGEMYANDDTHYKFITSDGMAWAYIRRDTPNASTGDRSSRAIMLVDVNGPKKGPNTMGRDIFAFLIYPTTGIKPDGSFDWEDSSAKLSPSTTFSCDPNAASGDAGKGYHCSSKVLTEGKMDY